MRGATSPRLLLELMCAQVLLPASAAPDRTASESDVGDLAARVERLERQLAAASGAGPQDPRRPSARSAAARTEAPSPAAAPKADGAPAAPAPTRPAGSGRAGAPDADELRNRWPDVLDAIRDTSKVAWILLGKASVESVEGDVITMAFDSEGNAKGFASSGSDGYLANVLERMFGARPVIRATANPAAAAGGGRSPARRQDRNPGGTGPPSPGPAPEAGASAGDDNAGSPGPSSGRAASSTRGSPGAGSATPAVARAGSKTGQGSRSGPRSGRRGGADQGKSSDGQAEGGRGREQSSGSELADDPRPHTDAAAEGGADLTGTDLIMRELGGRMIEEK